MRAAKAIFLFVILLFGVPDLMASDPVGIYGIIERVIFEPNEQSPERIQIWGAFEYVSGGLNRPGATSKPQRGYLYFTLPAGEAQPAARTEWADLKAVAGTGQAIGFGHWGFVGNFANVESVRISGGPPYFLELYPGGGRKTDARVRPPSEAPVDPGVYATNTGIVKLSERGSHKDIVNQLKEALQTK